MTRHLGGVPVALCLAFAAATGSNAQSPTRPADFSVLEATIDGVHEAFDARRLTCRALVERYLARIDSYDQRGPHLNAVQTANPRALQEADRLDAAFRVSGRVGSLHCVPVLVKDQVDTADLPTTYGSVLFKTFVPSRDATIVSKLKAAGAIVIGKATMGEFASGYLSSASGPIRNPYDPRRHASGSSGGTGAGVASSFAMVGIAEDTGGSIRGPAAVAGLVGLRPTVPLVSRFGMLPSRPTQDTLGPVARTVRDAARILDVIAGYDPNDPVTAQAVGHVPPSYLAALAPEGLKGARIGVVRQPMDPKADPTSEDYAKVRAVMDTAIADLGRQGAVVEQVVIERLAERINVPYDANVFETDPAMNRYFAQHPNAPYKTLRDILLSGKVVPSRTRVLMGSVGRSPDEAGYLRVLAAAAELRETVFNLMAERKLDALVYATFDHQPVQIGSDDMTNPALDTSGRGNNRRLSPLIGFPAITVPAGLTSDGMPVGLEFLARPYAEPTLLKFAYAYEQATRRRVAPPTVPALTSHR